MQYNKKLLIYGKGGHAKVVAESIPGNYFFADDNDFDPALYSPLDYFVFVAIGNNKIRKQIQIRLEYLGYEIPNIVHPTSYISPTAILGHGIYIGVHAVINPNSIIENGVIINTGTTIDHDCFIGSFSHIAPGTHLCGNVNIGKNILIGVGSSVIPKIKIADNCIIAGGSSVSKNLEISNSLYAGNPAIFKKII